MQRLAMFDVGREYTRPWARSLAQLVFGLLCAVLTIGVSLALNGTLRAGPFALVYPTVLIATLYGRWRAGLVAGLLTFGWGWYVELPGFNSFRIETAIDRTRVVLNALSTLVTLLLAESFRRLVDMTIAERDAEVARSALLLQELDHRTKNNFALVVSLLGLQARDTDDPHVKEALDMATARVHSFARAHASLGDGRDEVGSVAMKPYLTEMTARFAQGAFRDNIDLSVEVADIRLSRDTAVAIALFANEALTNCSKYAFPDGRSGRVDVRFAGDAESWELVVADDGVGAAPSASRRPGADHGGESGLGTRLMNAFAERARARCEIERTSRGRRVRLISADPVSPSWRGALHNVLANSAPAFPPTANAQAS
jgi:two-component sensor histidine kinase